MDENIPTETTTRKNLKLTLMGTVNIDHPVYVDIISGSVYEIPISLWRKEEGKLILDTVPVWDAPILVADKSLINLK